MMRPVPPRSAAAAALLLLAACASTDVTGGGEAAGPPLTEPEIARTLRPCPGEEAALARARAEAAARQAASAAEGGEKERILVSTDSYVGTRAGTRRPPGPDTPRRAAVFRLQVDSSGRVTSARLERGTGDAEKDRILGRNVERQRFHPGLPHPFPVPGCALQTVYWFG